MAASAGRWRRNSAGNGYTRAFVLPNSWKSALVPWLARIPQRIGYIGEARYGLLNDIAPPRRKALPRLVDRFAALAVRPGELVPMPPRPVLVPEPRQSRRGGARARLRTDRKSAILCPGAEYGPAKRWPPTHFAELAATLPRATACRCGSSARPNDKLAAESVLQAAGESSRQVRDLTGRTDLGTAIDLLSLGLDRRQQRFGADACGSRGRPAAGGAVRLVVAGLHAAAVDASRRSRRSTSPAARASSANVPLGHFKCMRDLAPRGVYDLAQMVLLAEPGDGPPVSDP